MIDWTEVGRRLDAARQEGAGIVLATHVNADGDGLGSEIGFHHFLRQRGHRVSIINNDPVPARYRFLDPAGDVTVYDPSGSPELIAQASLFFVLDNASPARLGRMLPDVEASAAFKICIDHHPDPDPFWDLRCVDVDACASGQLVYEAIKTLGGAITGPIAEALYVSFVTDTGHFRFGKTTAQVHRIIADLMDTGAISPPRVYRALFEGITPGLNRLVGYALADAHYEYGGRFAWARLTHDQLASCDGFDEDTGDLVNMLLAVQGVEAAALFKEMPGGRTKVSLRSLGDVDVNRLAATLGGGGHTNASGILMSDCSFAEGVRKVVEGMAGVLQATA